MPVGTLAFAIIAESTSRVYWLNRPSQSLPPFSSFSHLTNASSSHVFPDMSPASFKKVSSLN
jgi:hypothetical protein